MSSLLICLLFFLVLHVVFIVLKNKNDDETYGIMSSAMMFGVFVCVFANIYLK